jgi:SNF2 family DNA or RNA helicase
MALSTIVKKPCPVCGEVAIEKSRVSLKKEILISLQCGHLVAQSKLNAEQENPDARFETYTNRKGEKLRPFQIECVKFAEAANARIIIADEQGLGKTIEAISVLHFNRNKLFPAAIVVPTAVKHQWFYQIQDWMPDVLTQVISSGKEMALPGFQIYIISYDLLKNEKVFSMVTPKTVIIDECQYIKDHTSGRGKAVSKLAKLCEHVIPMSGTPIKNHAGEYFTALNITQPTRFPEFSRFIREDCDSYATQYGYKVGGLRDAAAFKAKTEDFIIRRTQAEVLPDLPPFERLFQHCEFDARLNNAYRDGLKELENLMYSDENENTMTSTIAIMSKLRKLTGISKVPETVEFVTDFLQSTDRKIIVFVHHHDAHYKLELDLNAWMAERNMPKCLNYSAALNSDQREQVKRQFINGPERVMILSTLAGGVGLDGLQEVCSDVIMHERQWNPSNEEQAEKRVASRFGQKRAAKVNYMIATGTIDEYFTDLVEQKRAIVANTLDGKDVAWDQNSLLKELTNILVTKGRERWRL